MSIKAGNIPLIVFCLVSSNCFGYDWYVDPAFSATERYTDNLRLTTYRESGNLITTLSPSVLLGYLDDINEIKANLNWNQLIYHDQAALDFSEKLANIDYRRMGERWLSELQLNYGDQATLGSESVQLGVNGSGLVSIQVPRYTTSISPSLSYRLTEKNTVQLSGSYSQVSYGPHPTVGLGFSNYTNQQLSTSFNHAYSEVLSLNLTGSYTDYQTSNSIPGTFNFNCQGLGVCTLPGRESFSQNSTTFNIQSGLSYDFSEKWTVNLSAGLRDSITASKISIYPSQSSIALPLNSPTNYTLLGKTYSASISRSLEKGSLSFSANQQLNPASTGTQQQTTQFSANGNFQLAERWSATLNASYLISNALVSVTSQGVVNNPASFNRTLTSLSSGLKWQWTPDIHVELSYSYLDQNYTQTGQTAAANNMQMQFIYQPTINRQVK